MPTLPNARPAYASPTGRPNPTQPHGIPTTQNAARARSYGLEAEIFTPQECADKMTHDGVTLIRTEDLQVHSMETLTTAFQRHMEGQDTARPGHGHGHEI